MRAVGYQQCLPVTDPKALQDIDIDPPTLRPRDVLVRVEAVSVNPVDVKVRQKMAPEQDWRILGFDAAGVVVETGAEAAGFAPGDRVFYAGDITRPGSNAALQAVDARIVGRAPVSLDPAQAAALPLTAITAWEMLFDGFRLNEGGGAGDALLIVGAAGGVGSILIQLAKALTDLEVIASASRPETTDWVKRLGADHVVDHSRPMAPQLRALGRTPRYIAALTGSERHFDDLVEAIAPRGTIALIDDPNGLDIAKIKPKALTFHWEFMFTRPMFETPDMDRQGALLGRVADLADSGAIRSTAVRALGPMSAAALREAHRLQETGSALGKTVLTGFA